MAGWLPPPRSGLFWSLSSALVGIPTSAWSISRRNPPPLGASGPVRPGFGAQLALFGGIAVGDELQPAVQGEVRGVEDGGRRGGWAARSSPRCGPRGLAGAPRTPENGLGERGLRENFGGTNRGSFQKKARYQPEAS